jgi:CAP-Gly domain
LLLSHQILQSFLPLTSPTTFMFMYVSVSCLPCCVVLYSVNLLSWCTCVLSLFYLLHSLYSSTYSRFLLTLFHIFLQVVDSDPNNTAQSLTDVSQVEKYQISEDAYAQRNDTFRKFKNRFLADDIAERKEKRQQEKETQELQETKLATEVKVGMRCEVAGSKRGVVKFVGDVKFHSGKWVGVQLDEPLGKHNGT